MVIVSPGTRWFDEMNFLTQALSLKIQRGCFVFLSVGMSVFIGSDRPSTRNVIGVPSPAFLDGPPKTSCGKNSLPHERIFRLPCLRAAAVSSITRDSILQNAPYEV